MVQFIENNMDEQSSDAIEVVPSSWVYLEDTIEKCLWPDKNARKFIKKQTVPKSNWENHDYSSITNW